MSEQSQAVGVQPWVFAVTILSVLLAIVLGFWGWKKWRQRRMYRYGRRRSGWDNRRTQYYELERRGGGDRDGDQRRERRYGQAEPPRGFAVKSGVSPISPGPVWSSSRQGY